MDSDIDTTIAALSTAPAPSGVAVIRLSGTASLRIAESVFVSKKKLTTHPRTLIYGIFFDSNNNLKLDSCLCVFMPGPYSFTGEDICEFHLHGSPVLVREALRCLYAAGAKPAEPGAFTRRAFMNGKLDLIQAEAIGDIIEASSQEALKLAQNQLDGRLSAIVRTVGEPLKDTLAEIEAGIDFPEEDIDPAALKSMLTSLEQIEQTIASLVRSYEYGHVVREGFRVLLYGKPNVGKSSLLNHFLGTDRAIVTEISGTTRDTLEEQVLIHGVQFLFCDTAGVTDTTDTVEKIGIERAKQRVDWADLVLFMLDAGAPDSDWESAVAAIESRTPVWPVVNKIDAAPDYCISHPEARYISVHSGAGCDTLQKGLLELVQQKSVDAGAVSEIVTNERHRDCLEKAREALKRTSDAIISTQPAEIISAELRAALSNLEELVGRTETEDILGRIFSKFCIGK